MSTTWIVLIVIAGLALASVIIASMGPGRRMRARRGDQPSPGREGAAVEASPATGTTPDRRRERERSGTRR